MEYDSIELDWCPIGTRHVITMCRKMFRFKIQMSGASTERTTFYNDLNIKKQSICSSFIHDDKIKKYHQNVF